jgi:membrane protein implicated in regulation of membrane protease activity
MWVLLGFSLLALEIVTPGTFFFLFFGIGAVAVGILASLDVAGSVAMQWLLFSIISLVCLVPLRGRLLRWVASGEDLAKGVDTLIGQTAVVLEDLLPGAMGKAELRGTAWNARNVDEQALHKGQRAKVTRVDGLTLWIRAE